MEDPTWSLKKAVNPWKVCTGAEEPKENTLSNRLILKNDMMILAKKKIFETIADNNHTCLECLKIHDLISPLSF
ncbi:hypothetical protein HGM15179_005633 [Zosterops borbonicus]|uniref:Uncharacterized protein n=1 Tax=Zosterops borbonicus TaxID=364589 RepID=A0A8K1GLY4_9PASS|nr:hypothetical protein HGM15179_005633 [Zosterops borbonicus]